MKYSKNFYLACENLVNNCANISTNEQVLIISNKKTEFIGNEIAIISKKNTPHVDHIVIKEFQIHGQAPPHHVHEKMLQANIIFSLTSKSLAHAKATFDAINNGAKFLSLPDYSLPVIESPSLLTNFQDITPISKKIANLLTNANTIKITSQAGTNLTCNIKGRKANPAPGWCYEKGIIASPPDAETNIALIEDSTNGFLVVDGSIPCDEIGLLNNPLKLEFKNGKVINITGEKSNILNTLFDKDNNPNYRIAAEFGIGLNAKAKLRGFMLEDEGTLGTIHIGIGANIVLGGENAVPFHLDHIIKSPSIYLDNNKIMNNGNLLI
jgi:leucyl aminopeptidase (aminopeptidase T)